jgi:hypothetical protein
MASIFPKPEMGLRPRPGATSHKPLGPSCGKRARHRITGWRFTPGSRAIALSDRPAAGADTRAAQGLSPRRFVGRHPLPQLLLVAFLQHRVGWRHKSRLTEPGCPVICWTLARAVRGASSGTQCLFLS